MWTYSFIYCYTHKCSRCHLFSGQRTLTTHKDLHCKTKKTRLKHSDVKLTNFSKQDLTYVKVKYMSDLNPICSVSVPVSVILNIYH